MTSEEAHERVRYIRDIICYQPPYCLWSKKDWMEWYDLSRQRMLDSGVEKCE